MPRPEFAVHMLNDLGKERAEDIAEAFSSALDEIEYLVGSPGNHGREMSIVRTKMEEASFFAKKAMASQKENQL